MVDEEPYGYELRDEEGRFKKLFKGPGAKEKADKEVTQRNRYAEKYGQQVRVHVEALARP